MHKSSALYTFLSMSLTGYSLFYLNIFEPVITFTIVSVVNSILFFVLTYILLKENFNRTTFLLIISAGIIFRIILLPIPPASSDDIYRYIWDGKVQATGINPYRYNPTAKELNFLHTEDLPSKVNFPQMKTIYPPYSQFVFLLSYKLFGESFWGVKIFLFISELLTIFLLFLLLKELKLPEKNAAIYALCPLPIIQFMVDGHIDGIGFPFLLLFLLFYMKGKKTASFIAYGLSISAKLISGMLVPFIVQKEKGKWILLSAVIPIIILLLTYLPYFSKDVFVFESLFAFTSHWMFNGSVFSIIYNFVEDNQKARIMSYILFAIPGTFLFFSKKEIIEKSYLLFFFFFLFSPTVHPWYLTWLALLIPLNFRWSGLAFVVLVNLASYVVIDYRLYGIWKESAILLLIEYVPVYSIFMLELYKKKLFNPN